MGMQDIAGTKNWSTSGDAGQEVRVSWEKLCLNKVCIEYILIFEKISIPLQCALQVPTAARLRSAERLPGKIVNSCFVTPGD